MATINELDHSIYTIPHPAVVYVSDRKQHKDFEEMIVKYRREVDHDYEAKYLYMISDNRGHIIYLLLEKDTMTFTVSIERDLS